MIKVITYGTYDMLHYGHIRLLERAKALGDYLIVGVTSDDYDKTRGKINLQQSLTERIEAVRGTGLADLIVVEEYEGQKIDDIKRYDVDIFTVGSDWEGHFDYLKEYCRVIYLPRTDGISSSDIRSHDRELRLGFIGDNESRILNKYCSECKFVNGAKGSGVCSNDREVPEKHEDIQFFDDYEHLLECSDAIYIISHPSKHYEQIRKAILAGKHVLVELPITLNEAECKELFNLAEERNVVLMSAMKTAYATAYNRLLLLIKGRRIGKVLAIDATCTSIRQIDTESPGYKNIWNSICAWGPTAMLPIFHVLGTNYNKSIISSLFLDKRTKFDAFTSIHFEYDNALATLKVARSAKSEGELVITGTKGYIYVPAPWWKTDYFEIRYEDQCENKRYFYQLDGEGIRYELVAFMKAISTGKDPGYISKDISVAISKVINQFYDGVIHEIVC